MDKSLITVEDIRKFRPLSKEINTERINPFIFEAQHNDLAPVMTPALYNDFVSKYDQTGDGKYSDYQKLLNGDTYIPTGKTSPVIYEGIVPMLVYYTLARWYENHSINVTRFGLVQKNTDQSEPIQPAVINQLVETLRSNAIAYQNELIRYITDKIDTFPLYEGTSETINRTGLKFFDV